MKRLFLVLIITLLFIGVVSADTYTWGYTSVGASFDYWANSAYGYNFTAPADISGATFVSFHKYNPTNPYDTRHNKGMIWNSDATLVSDSVTPEFEVSGTVGWSYANFSSSPSITPGTSYYIGFARDGDHLSYYKFDAGTAGYFFRGTVNYGTPGSYSSATTGSDKMSMYITYETAAGGDTTPPESIYNITNVTTCNSINWTWTNPGGDQNETVIWKDGVLRYNVSNTTTFDLWTSLSENTAYIFSSKTKDAAGNLNATFQNQTATTNLSVTAAFTKNQTAGLQPLSVLFNDTSTGTTLTQWNWSWGDGTWTNGTTRNTTKTYASGGTYSVFLIGANPCGPSTSASQTINVYNQTSSVAIAPSPASGLTGDPIQLTPSGVNATKYNWFFPNGTSNLNTTSAAINTFFASGGTYSVRLNITDNGWGGTQVNATVNVYNRTVTGFTANVTSGVQPLHVGFTVDTVNDNATFWNWSFGTGEGWQNGTTQNATHIYNNVGTFTVIEIANNPYANNTTTRTNYITVTSGKPAANFVANNTTVCTGQYIQFNDTSTNTPTSWYWEFGDSTTNTTQNPLKAYSSTGLKSVKLTATNAYGEDEEEKNEYINVIDCTPPASVTNIANSTACNSINFTWTNPADADFDGIMNWLNGTAQTNMSKTTTFKLVSGLADNVAVTLATKTYDTSKNVNATFQNHTATTPDCTPPASIAGLANDTTTCEQINWTWTNPTDTDFNHTVIWQNETFLKNATNTTTFDLWTGLTGGIAYNFSSKTVDISGNENASFVNMTATPTACTVAPVSSFVANDTDGCSPLGVQFNDTSTNTPTNWDWYWSPDETKDSDDQNASTTFTTGVYNVRLYTSNSAGGNWSNQTGYITVNDCTPPASVTGLTNVTETCNTITWAWVNPADADFNHTMIYQNGTFLYNLSNATATDIWGSLPEMTTYEIATHTVDIAGNVNLSWENKTTITPPCGIAPVANFTVDNTSVCLGSAFQFNDTSTNTPTKWGWMFGDTGTSILQNPAYIYENTGTYNVFLNASNSYGSNWSNKTGFVTVRDCTPSANVTGLAGTVNCSSINWTWTLPKDGDYDLTMIYQNGTWLKNITTAESDIWYNLSESLEYIFSSQTVDLSGNVNTSWTNLSKTTDACGAAPVANFTSNVTEVCIGDYVAFNDTSTNSPDTWFWLFGTGGVDSHLQHPITNTFDTVGLWNVSFNASNSYGFDWENKTNYINVTDCTPPSGVTNLNNTTTTCNEITWTWDEPADPDFDYVYALRNGTWIGNYSSSPTTWAGLVGGVEYEISLKTVDIYGNMNATWQNMTATPTICPDVDAPPSISNLANSTAYCPAAINWTWTNPNTTIYTDFNHTVIYQNDTWLKNVSNTTTFDLWSGLVDETSYNFSSFTVDFAGNENSTWVNMTATTNDCTGVGAVTGLTNTTTCNSVLWDWTNPPDADYDQVMVYRFDEGDPLGEYFYHFVNAPTSEDNWTGLAEDTNYTISLVTVDIHANVNYTWQNMTAMTGNCTVPPVAAFSANDTTTCLGDPVKFTDASTNTPTAWNWSFGDGVYNETQNPEYIYALGTWTVNMFASNAGGGDWENKTNYITITDCKPVVDFSASDTTVCIGENVTFTDTSTNSPTGWYWLFGDSNSSFLQNPSHNWSWAGDFNISLKANNDYGDDAETKNYYINVTNCDLPPVASFTSNVTCGNVNFSVQYTDTSTGAAITSWYWDFGDGVNSTERNPIINYTAVGLYDVDHNATSYLGTSWSNVTGYMTAKPNWDSCAPSGGMQYDTNTYKPGWFNSWWV